ncbi:AIR carboxylase family protein [Coxiella-like endosymbiont]|uniref:AIR carboxylase family protein n=1 Tax=Coxiella-like endosymbiont TaxID=1592897 RepID=UPI00272A7DC2|nr:AIR carboxylase family protein [Coxiella-like endosymbiont]
MNKSFIAILMGSDSDLSVMETTVTKLKSLDIPFEARILSAHRTPETIREFIETAEKRRCTVFIAAIGLAAHLAGTVAAYTIKPVIGIQMGLCWQFRQIRRSSFNCLNARQPTVFSCYLQPPLVKSELKMPPS